MVVTLLIGLLAVIGTGLALYALHDHAGPLAGLAGPERTIAGGGIRQWKEIHEILANLMLVLVIVHVAGVLLASHVHHENLIKAMVTGRKRAPST
jgi:cytochrome b